MIVGLSIFACGGGRLDLAVPPLPTLPVVPPFSALAVALLTLVLLFSLITFNEFLVALALVPVPLPVLDFTEAFVVGMEVMMSKRCL
jgi:hypothetical protein